MEENQQTTTKLQFVTTDEVWNKVLKYKIEKSLKNNNQAVEELLSKALEPIASRKDIISNGLSIPPVTFSEISEFSFSESEDVDKLLDKAEQKLFAISQESLKKNFIPIKSILIGPFSEYFGL